MKVLSVFETAIYVDDLDAAAVFYQDVLGLKVIFKDPDRHVFFQVGNSNVLLAFNPSTTLTGDGLPLHGATGPGHFALGIKMQHLDDWRKRIVSHGIAIEAEVEWPPGGKSIYSRDPAGNSVDLVTHGIWQLPSGWYRPQHAFIVFQNTKRLNCHLVMNCVLARKKADFPAIPLESLPKPEGDRRMTTQPLDFLRICFLTSAI